MCPVAPYHGKDMTKPIRPADRIVSKKSFNQNKQKNNFVIVPSISEMTTRSVESQTNIRAVAAIAPEADKEKVIALAPGRRLRDF